MISLPKTELWHVSFKSTTSDHKSPWNLHVYWLNSHYIPILLKLLIINHPDWLPCPSPASVLHQIGLVKTGRRRNFLTTADIHRSFTNHWETMVAAALAMWMGFPIIPLNQLNCHWIGLRENLQETHGFLPSNIGLSCKFSHHPILWNWQQKLLLMTLAPGHWSSLLFSFGMRALRPNRIDLYIYISVSIDWDGYTQNALRGCKLLFTTWHCKRVGYVLSSSYLRYVHAYVHG